LRLAVFGCKAEDPSRQRVKKLRLRGSLVCKGLYSSIHDALVSSIASSRSWLRVLFPMVLDGAPLRLVRRPLTGIVSASFMSRFCCVSTMSS
jgi:hypothetical protein